MELFMRWLLCWITVAVHWTNAIHRPNAPSGEWGRSPWRQKPPLRTPPYVPHRTPPYVPHRTPPYVPHRTPPYVPHQTPPYVPLQTRLSVPLRTPPYVPLRTPPYVPLQTRLNLPVKPPAKPSFRLPIYPHFHHSFNPPYNPPYRPQYPKLPKSSPSQAHPPFFPPAKALAPRSVQPPEYQQQQWWWVPTNTQTHPQKVPQTPPPLPPRGNGKLVPYWPNYDFYLPQQKQQVPAPTRSTAPVKTHFEFSWKAGVPAPSYAHFLDELRPPPGASKPGHLVKTPAGPSFERPQQRGEWVPTFQ